jgi:tRNA1Val (adenine37-N6)-methyltransferase
MADIIIQMRSAGIEPKYIRMIHSSRQMKAKRILVEGKKGSRHGITIGPPLIIYRKNGSYTDEARAMFMP